MTRRTFSRWIGCVGAAAIGTLLASAPASAQYAIPQTAEAVPRMSMADFKARVDSGDVIAVDVRSLADYRLGHIPGARSIPLNDVQPRLGELRGLGKPIVTYCT
jgi:3-mercaptopyruvate sulfurtransferase SseA